MQNANAPKNAAASEADTKQAYVRPEVYVHGSVSQLTATIGNGVTRDNPVGQQNKSQ
jgi:hypothetical protein